MCQKGRLTNALTVQLSSSWQRPALWTLWYYTTNLPIYHKHCSTHTQTRPQSRGRPDSNKLKSDSIGQTWGRGWVSLADSRHWRMGPPHSLRYSAVVIRGVSYWCTGWRWRAISFLFLFGELVWWSQCLAAEIFVFDRDIKLNLKLNFFVPELYFKMLQPTCCGGALIWSFRINMASSCGSGFFTNTFASFLQEASIKWSQPAYG